MFPHFTRADRGAHAVVGGSDVAVGGALGVLPVRDAGGAVPVPRAGEGFAGVGSQECDRALSARGVTAFSAETGCGSFTSTTRLSPEAGGGVEGVGVLDEGDGGVVDEGSYEGGTEGCGVDGDVSIDEGGVDETDGLDDEGSATAVETPTPNTTHIEATENTERLTVAIFNTPPTLNLDPPMGRLAELAS